jgi:hypothetical protein
MLTRCGLVGKEAEMLKSVDLSADVVVLPFTDVRLTLYTEIW